MKDGTTKLKRILLLTIITLLIGSGLPAISHAQEKSEFIRVGLNFTSAATKEVGISASEGLAVWDFKSDETFLMLTGVKQVTLVGEAGELFVKGDTNEQITVDMEGRTIPVAGLLSKGYALVSSDYMDYLNAEVKTFDSVIRFNNKAYRGGMSFMVNANDTIQVINKLSIDEYTYGVINGEMNCSNPLEALKAQAVVARSYAITNMGRHEFSGYDLCDSTHCQVYKGYEDEHPQTNQAVNDTKNLGIFHENLPVAPYYFKNSGGHTQNVEDVWNGKLGYLRGVLDPYSPSYKWETTFTFSELESKLKMAGYNVGAVKSVAIIEKNSAGAVSSIEFKGSSGTTVLFKEKIRTVLGPTALKSTLFNMDSGTQSSVSEMFLMGNKASDIAGQKIHILNGAGKTVELNILNSYITDQKALAQLFGYKAGEPAVTGDSVTFRGSGYGHGVGMPQDSAIAMAKAGFDFKEILNYYYKDIEIY